jgi:Tfp pilus assembly protein PilV
MCTRKHARGLTLVELIIFIVVVSAAVAGVLAVFTQATRASSDPLIRKQAIAVAESLLEEILAVPYTCPQWGELCRGDHGQPGRHPRGGGLQRLRHDRHCGL